MASKFLVWGGTLQYMICQSMRYVHFPLLDLIVGAVCIGFAEEDHASYELLVLLDSVPYEVVPFRIYTLNLLPAPQYSY